MSHWYSKGQAIDAIAIDDRAVQYGDGLFETVAIRNGELRLIDRHLQRLQTGCDRLGIAMPDDLERELAEAVEQSGELTAHCVAKIIVSSGVGKRGYGRSSPTPGSVFIGVFPARPVAAGYYRDGVTTMACNTRLAAPSPTAGLKTLNRLEQVLGRSECQESGAFEGLMSDADDHVICGTMSNVFIVKDENISTPSLDRCGVAGVMRALTIDTLSEQGATVEVRDIHVTEFEECDEAFLSNSQFGLLPIARFGQRRWSDFSGTRKVMTALANAGIVECAS